MSDYQGTYLDSSRGRCLSLAYERPMRTYISPQNLWPSNNPISFYFRVLSSTQRNKVIQRSNDTREYSYPQIKKT